MQLSHINGFEDDYDKVVYGFKHSLILKRASDSDAIIRDGGVAAGKVELNSNSMDDASCNTFRQREASILQDNRSQGRYPSCVQITSM
jgi:hypothetical protein